MGRIKPMFRLQAMPTNTNTYRCHFWDPAGDNQTLVNAPKVDLITKIQTRHLM